uniref:MARVEL domain-containing protein n=1 Tax=Ditylenchus dipsaci TaxID=166011 RepID=A0A915DDJ1_9BILA
MSGKKCRERNVRERTVRERTVRERSVGKKCRKEMSGKEVSGSHLHFWPWNVSDLIFSTVAAITFVVLGLLEAYYATGAWSNNCNDTGGDGIIHNGCRFIYEWAFASFFCFVNAILYAISAVLARKERDYEL